MPLLASRLPAALLGLSLVAAGCAAAPAVSPEPAPPTSATAQPASRAPATPGLAETTPPAESPSVTPPAAAPYDGAEPGSGEGLKIGYISLSESIPFVALVSGSIREQAELAGAEIVFCDSELDAGKALACAQQMSVQEVDGILNFQAFAESAPEICAAGPDVPVIAIDIVQEPCQVAFMGANNRRAGEIAGEALGEFIQAQFDCQYDMALTLESPQVGEVNEARIGGFIDGFASVCGEVPEANLQRLGVGGTTDAAVTQVGDALSAIEPGSTVVVMSLNDDMLLGAFAAARTAGREADMFGAAQGADPSSWQEIACNPNWVADSAYFPERYGRILVPAIIDAINGEQVPEMLFTPHEAITADNIRDVYPDTPEC